MPDTARSNDVFPAPLAPSSVTIFPGCTSRLTPRKTWIAAPYTTSRLRTARTGPLPSPEVTCGTLTTAIAPLKGAGTDGHSDIEKRVEAQREPGLIALSADREQHARHVWGAGV